MAQAVLERVGATPLDALSMQAGARGATLGAAGRGDAPVVVIGGGPGGHARRRRPFASGARRGRVERGRNGTPTTA